jgi:hypothetical protein
MRSSEPNADPRSICHNSTIIQVKIVTRISMAALFSL